MYGLAGGFLAAAWGRLLTPALTALSLLLWWSLAHFFDGSPMVPWSSVNSLMFQAAALYFLLKSTPAAGPRPLAYPLLCGVSAGLCYWCRFNVGLPLIAALGVSYLILACAAGERPLASRRLYAFVVGNFTVHLAFLAIIVSTGATTDWIDQNYTWHAKVFATTPGTPRSLPARARIGPSGASSGACSYRRHSGSRSGATPCGPSCRSSRSSGASPHSPSVSWR
jgi:hypothetical protein